MITLSNKQELTTTKEAIDQLKEDCPQLYAKLLHVVHLTRTLQFKYQYLGSLILEEDSNSSRPQFIYSSILRLYKSEVQKLKDDENHFKIKSIFKQNKHTGIAKICLLVIGHTPETLIGASSIQ